MFARYAKEKTMKSPKLTLLRSLLSALLFHRIDRQACSKEPAREMSRFLVLTASLAIYAITCPSLQAQNVIGGSVAGLTAGGTVVLQNNGGPPLSVASDGIFAFPATLPNGAAYSVTIETLPSGETCSLANA